MGREGRARQRGPAKKKTRTKVASLWYKGERLTRSGLGDMRSCRA